MLKDDKGNEGSSIVRCIAKAVVLYFDDISYL